MKKILITGGSGFVGRNVKEYLEKKNNEYIIYAPDSIEVDCLNENAVKQYLTKEKFDIVLHFAVYGDGIDKSKDGSKILEYNLRMFLNFYNCSDLYGKMIYTGSGAEYNKNYSIIEVTEEDVHKSIPTDQYGLMKYTVNRLIEQSKNIYNLKLFGIYGKYEYWQTKFISNVCCKAIMNIPLTMRQNVYFDYLWIDDFCKMAEQFMNLDNPQFHSYNAVNGTKIDLETICRIVLEVSGMDLPVHICKSGLAYEYTASNLRIMQELKGFDYTPQKQAIRELYLWYFDNKQDISLLDLLY